MSINSIQSVKWCQNKNCLIMKKFTHLWYPLSLRYSYMLANYKAPDVAIKMTDRLWSHSKKTYHCYRWTRQFDLLAIPRLNQIYRDMNALISYRKRSLANNRSHPTQCHNRMKRNFRSLQLKWLTKLHLYHLHAHLLLSCWIARFH